MIALELRLRALPFTSRRNQWEDLATGESVKPRTAGDGSVVYQNEDGTYSYAHLIEGIGLVIREARFVLRGLACLSCDLDYLDANWSVGWVNRDAPAVAAA